MPIKNLKKYQQKRNFKKTPEPAGKISSNKKLIFVIHKHAASHLHYDLRLSWQGVLKSWAVPKGPSYNPHEKRLAVEVEDHPLEYANFEGVIPEGEYGAGTVMLWDKGFWSPIEDPEKGFKKGKLIFILNGKKLKGQWNLIKTKFPGRKNNWLLIKSSDQYANMLSEKELLNTVSIKSKMDMKQIAKKNEKK